MLTALPVAIPQQQKQCISLPYTFLNLTCFSDGLLVCARLNCAAEQIASGLNGHQFTLTRDMLQHHVVLIINGTTMLSFHHLGFQNKCVE